MGINSIHGTLKAQKRRFRIEAVKCHPVVPVNSLVVTEMPVVSMFPQVHWLLHRQVPPPLLVDPHQ